MYYHMFGHLTALKRHKISHSEVLQYRCILCNFFKNMQLLLDYIIGVLVNKNCPTFVNSARKCLQERVFNTTLSDILKKILLDKGHINVANAWRHLHHPLQLGPPRGLAYTWFSDKGGRGGYLISDFFLRRGVGGVGKFWPVWLGLNKHAELAKLQRSYSKNDKF